MATSEHATAASRRLPSCPPHPWMPSQDLRKVLGREARREPRSREVGVFRRPKRRMMKLVTDTYHTDSRKSHACLDFALAWIMDHMDMDGGLGLERRDWTDWTGGAGNLPCLHLTSHSPHRGRRQTKKKPCTRIRKGVLRAGTRGRCLIRRVFRKLASPSCPDLEKSLPLPLRFPFPAYIFCLLGLCLVFALGTLLL